MVTIKRTRSRRFPLLLRAEHDDRGPYYLVDRAGYGVAFRGRGHQRDFAKALMAFDLCEFDDSITPKEAKAAVDNVFRYKYRTEPQRFWDALSRIEKARAKKVR